jgi:uncharacterized protein (DUF1330 family)
LAFGHVSRYSDWEKYEMKDENETEKTAYMIASVNVVEPDKMGPYMEACGPLFAAAGIELFALGVSGSTVEVLEGDWPYGGALQLYKAPSMDVLLEFWNSPEYQEAIKLREGIVKSDFTVAIESTS